MSAKQPLTLVWEKTGSSSPTSACREGGGVWGRAPRAWRGARVREPAGHLPPGREEAMERRIMRQLRGGLYARALQDVLQVAARQHARLVIDVDHKVQVGQARRERREDRQVCADGVAPAVDRTAHRAVAYAEDCSLLQLRRGGQHLSGYRAAAALCGERAEGGEVALNLVIFLQDAGMVAGVVEPRSKAERCMAVVDVKVLGIQEHGGRASAAESRRAPWARRTLVAARVLALKAHREHLTQ